MGNTISMNPGRPGITEWFDCEEVQLICSQLFARRTPLSQRNYFSDSVQSKRHFEVC